MEIDLILKDYFIVIYDGTCGFCNSSVQFVIQQNPSKDLRFISYESELGQRIRSKLGIDESIDSIIVIENGQYFVKSAAIIKILNKINSPWRQLRYITFIPLFITDFVYDMIASNRYKVSRDTECRVLSKEELKLFF